jgi:hypothetical protein
LINDQQINTKYLGCSGRIHEIKPPIPEGKRLLGRPRRRWVDSIKINLREIGRDGVYWIDLAQEREQWRAVGSTVMNFWVP